MNIHTGLKFNRRIPELPVEIDYPVILYYESFVLKQLLHCRGIAKVMFTGKHAVPVHHTVSRYEISDGMR